MSEGWGIFGLAYAVFLAAHVVPARPGVRRTLVGALGERLYLAIYNVVAVGLLVWLIAAANRAPYVGLWDPAPWQAWLALLAMLPACLLVALSVGAPNPFSFGGGDARRYDPEHPGIVGLTRHPLLAAMALWAAAHLLANGDLAHLLLFGGFLAMALAGMAALDRRRRRTLGEQAWRELRPRRRFDPSPYRLALGLVLYILLLHLHEPVIGVRPLPWP